jgi:hypothetical protein
MARQKKSNEELVAELAADLKAKREAKEAALAVNIQVQPIASVEAAVQELRDAGLDADADALAEVVVARRQELAEARAAKEREDEAERQRKIAAAQAEFEAKAAEYVVLRDEALAALDRYVAKAEPGMATYDVMQAAANALDLLTGGMVERPASAQAIFAQGDAAKRINAHNTFRGRANLRAV